MTQKEAIEYFESLLKRFEEMYETETSYWGKAHAETTIEATRMALSALRPVSQELVEKVWRGKWQRGTKDWVCSRCGRSHTFVKSFCPHCGAPNGMMQLIDEAPTLTPQNELEHVGLYGKYTVYKNKDGSLVTDCFILRPAKDPAAVIALRSYAAATDNAELSADIINWVGAEPNEHLTCDGCISLGTSYGPCMNCIRSRLRGDMYRRPPEGEEDT